MPLSTPLNKNPYWADYTPNKNYYLEIFKPGVSVQTRELTNMQLQLQNQIEKFGDNIFVDGTIVSGCNFQFLSNLPYVKLNDLDVFNNAAIPSSYLGLTAINKTTGLKASILNYANGFVTTSPLLKTLYLKYLNTGNNGSNNLSFTAGDTLTIQNPINNGIESVTVTNGGQLFSNTNQVLAVSALICTLTVGTPSVGNYLNNGNGLTNVEVISVDTTTLASTNQAIIVVAPRSVDLANASCNSQYWTFNVNDTVQNLTATAQLTVNQLVGSGFQANVITNSIGTIIAINPINKGVGYVYDPFITVQSPNNLAGYSTLSLSPQNFVTQVTVATTSNSVGNGYGFGVSQGVIFQKGFFINVLPQQILVDLYDTNPDNVAVGFITNEQIINFNIDQSLLDNANGQFNYQAPGADRMLLTPILQVVSTANLQTNSHFVPLVQWKAGQPYQQNQQTEFNVIEQEMAQRTEDADGDFVIEPFVVTTISPTTANQDAQYFNIVVNPGTAYISGYKVQTQAEYNVNDNNGNDTAITNNYAISLNYGNYLIVNNAAGTFQFNIGDTVNLYDTAKGFYTTPGSNLNPTGNQIGTANMRSLTLYQGQPGTGSAEYLLYLFNVKMNVGTNFANVCAVSYAPSAVNTGIADVVLTVSSNTNSNVAVLQATDQDQLLFYSGVSSLKNANVVSYNYRTANSSATCANGNASNATITINISSGSETFPYGAGTLSQQQLSDFYVVPTGGDWLYTSAVTGTVTVNTTSNVCVGSGTQFVSNLIVGDFVYVSSNSTGGHDVRQIASIVNSTYLTFTSANDSFANASATLTRVFPQYVPVPFGFRTRLTGNNNGAENIVTLQFGQPFTFSGTSTVTVGYNVARSNNPVQLTKTANRKNYVEFCTSNNAGGQTGPWCIGVPDVFRLRGVYIGNSSVTNTGSNYISSFYVDSGQNADFYNLSYLYLQQGASVLLTSNSYILCCFDYFTSSGVGYYDTVSYLQTSNAATIFTQDSLPLANLTTFCNSWEVPEVFTDDGTEIDLLGYIDFRPYAANTIAPTTNSAAAVLNPSNTVTLSTTGEKKFPVPSSNFTATIEGYLGRVDSLYVDQFGNFSIGTGKPNANLAAAQPPIQPIGTLKIVDIAIPQYPTLPTNPGINLTQIMNTNIVSNQKFATFRANNHVIYNLSANSALPYNQPPVFTMRDIGTLAHQVQQLQYYVDLTTLEDLAASLTIPSSVVAGQNRTAYGIFTDDFTTSQFSALNDPEYAAIKQGTNIVPSKMKWDEQMFGLPTIPYIEYGIIHQDVATVGGITDPLGLGPICALNLANTVAYTQLFRNYQDMAPGQTIDTVTIQMANSGTVFDNIANTTNTLSQWLINNQYSAYNFPGLGAGGQGFQFLENADLIAAGLSQYSVSNMSFMYDPSTQILTLIETATGPGIDTGINQIGSTQIVDYIPNIDNTTAELFGQAFQGTITWQQFFAGLNQTNSAPSGGQFNTGINYYPPVSLFFYNYDQGVRYDVYQGTTLVASTDPTAGVPTSQNLTAADIALLTGSAASNFFNDNTSTFMKNFQNVAGGYASYAGKITFNYNPNNGSNFTIKTTESPSATVWRWILAYPIDGESVGCIQGVVSANVSYSPIYQTYSYTQFCGNGAEFNGSINILVGWSATWNLPNPTPTTLIVPFDASQDWL